MYSSSFDDERPLPEEVRSHSSQSRVFCSVQDVACQHGQSVLTYTVTTQVFLQKHTTRSHNNLYSHMLRNNEQIPTASRQPIFSPARDISGDTDDELRPCRQQFTKTLTQPEAKTHQLTYKETTSYNRKLCKFSQFSHLETHLNTHSGENVKNKCKECDKRYHVLRNLKRDQQIHTGEKHFHCKQCDKSFKAPGVLNRRQLLHAGEVLPHRIFNEVGDLRTHLRIHTGEQPFPRKHHEKRFTQLPRLKQHLGEQPFHCERLPESHQQRPTGALKPFRCQQCGKSFRVSGSLTRHQRIHTGETPYYCGWCKKGFNVLSSLKRHQRVHTGEKPYRCEQCDRSFNEIGNLKTHQRTHTGEKPFQCRHCDKRFCQASHLKRHQTTHTGGETFHRV